MSTTGSLLIRDGTLIDGTGADPRPQHAVLVQDGRVTAVDHVDRIAVPGADVRVVEAGGRTILPGLIDTHVHLMTEGINIARDMAKPFSLRFYEAIRHARATLDAGVTTVRDAGGADAGLKAAIDLGLVEGPRVMISVTALGITGGHTDHWMLSGNTFHLMPAHPGAPDGICDGVDGVRRKVREVLRAGAEVVKICSTGGVMSPTDHPEFTQFSPEELDVIVREAAYRRGIKVMAHAQGAEGIKQALRAGVHSIEHGFYLDEEAIDLMLERGAYLVPTLLAPLAVVETAEAVGMPPHALEKAREALDAHRDSVRRAHAAGVHIAMGTDAGVMPHGSNLRELGLMVDIGMTPMEAIVATTKTAAECLGWDADVGTLEVGKRGDVVLVEGDPFADVRLLEDTANIALVVKDGVVRKDATGTRGRPGEQIA